MDLKVRPAEGVVPRRLPMPRAFFAPTTRSVCRLRVVLAPEPSVWIPKVFGATRCSCEQAGLGGRWASPGGYDGCRGCAGLCCSHSRP